MFCIGCQWSTGIKISSWPSLFSIYLSRSLFSVSLRERIAQSTNESTSALSASALIGHSGSTASTNISYDRWTTVFSGRKPGYYQTGKQRYSTLYCTVYWTLYCILYNTSYCTLCQLLCTMYFSVHCIVHSIVSRSLNTIHCSVQITNEQYQIEQNEYDKYPVIECENHQRLKFR